MIFVHCQFAQFLIASTHQISKGFKEAFKFIIWAWDLTFLNNKILYLWLTQKACILTQCPVPLCATCSFCPFLPRNAVIPRISCDMTCRARHNDGVDVFSVLSGVDGAWLETNFQCTDCRLCFRRLILEGIWEFFPRYRVLEFRWVKLGTWGELWECGSGT